MNRIKAIRNEEDYKQSLELLQDLLIADPDPNTERGEQLQILSTLIESYEATNFPIEAPTAVEAIKFRMDQLDLRPVDLVPFIGSKSRVSEILSGKRGLTVEMIRALEQGLQIPAESLIKPIEDSPESTYSKWDKKLYEIMETRGYFASLGSDFSDKVSTLQAFFNRESTLAPALLRQANYRSAPTTDRNALNAWLNFILSKASDFDDVAAYKAGSLSLEKMQELAKLSTKENGPLLAVDELKRIGIITVIEAELPKTRLDGAAVLLNARNPVIGLTLRLDRLDNFWFTLMHELAHIALHFDNDEIDVFYDELDEVKGLQIGSKESEADHLASEALVTSSKWEISPARIVPSPMAAASLARDLDIHIAIVAGKIRYETGSWAYLNKVVSNYKIRNLFPHYER
ncbi:ImmA/IrrE family metallo-endopeptidase [Candidatus Saccharibacteria bacterium]|nr:ImmA/IrrE family metallo-endopeptidase [Candidatus Saccharibacteria bacterium]